MLILRLMLKYWAKIENQITCLSEYDPTEEIGSLSTTTANIVKEDRYQPLSENDHTVPVLRAFHTHLLADGRANLI